MKILDRRISFNAGEISPLVEPRIDLEKYRMGCRTLKNMRPGIYGSAFSRHGLLHIAAQPNGGNAARLVAFEFNASTRMMLVFTAGEFTVYSTGTTPTIPTVTNETVDGIWVTAQAYRKGTWIRSVLVGYEGIYYCVESHTSSDFSVELAAGKWVAGTVFRRATPYLASELMELQFWQINDVIYITHPNHQQQVISRISNDRWTIAPLAQEYPALRSENIGTVQLTASATTGTAITVTASLATFQPGHVGSRWVIRHRRTEPVTALPLSSDPGDTSTPLFVLGDWSLTVISGQGTGQWDALAVVERSANGVGGWETIRSMPASRADRSGIITGTEIDPCYLRVRLVSKEGSAPDHGNYTLEAVDPDHYGIFEVTGYTSATSVTASVISAIGATSSTRYWAEPAWSGYRGWPRSVCIHEQRLVFGGNAAQPQTVWGSIIDDFHNFRVGADDDMGLALTFANQKANAIQWLVSQGALIIGTAGAEGPIGSPDSDRTLTPTNAKAGKFTNTGSAFIQALPVQDTVIFVQRNGRKAWEFSFSFERDGYKANDLTLLAEHITERQIVQIALQQAPDTTIWAIDSGGQLLGLAYERNQGVAGWFRYVTDGAFESVAVVSGDGEEDQIWVTVNRDGTRFIERFQPDRMRLLKDKDQAHICSADAAVIYDGAATTTVGGLSHLEGREVCVLADGAPVANRVVAGGEITLEIPASVVIVGLPFECLLQPTYMETNDPNTLSKPAWKIISRVDVELWNSLGCEVSASNGERWERVTFTKQGDLMDTAPPLFTGMKEVRVDSRSERMTSPIIRQTQPLPLNVMSLHVWHDANAI